MVTRVKKKNINCIGVQCNDSIVEIFWSKADVLMANKDFRECIYSGTNTIIHTENCMCIINIFDFLRKLNHVFLHCQTYILYFFTYI